MREIKFRGKIDGNWWYVTPEDDAWEQFWAIVDKKTIGQYTGLKDESCNEIYEGDIAEQLKDGFIGEIWYSVDSAGTYNVRNPDKEVSERQRNDLKVIGNIYENPELLKTNDQA